MFADVGWKKGQGLSCRWNVVMQNAITKPRDPSAWGETGERQGGETRRERERQRERPRQVEKERSREEETHRSLGKEVRRNGGEDWFGRHDGHIEAFMTKKLTQFTEFWISTIHFPFGWWGETALDLKSEQTEFPSLRIWNKLISRDPHEPDLGTNRDADNGWLREGEVGFDLFEMCIEIKIFVIVGELVIVAAVLITARFVFTERGRERERETETERERQRETTNRESENEVIEVCQRREETSWSLGRVTLIPSH
jgi:hypothetical protein